MVHARCTGQLSGVLLLCFCAGLGCAQAHAPEPRPVTREAERKAALAAYDAGDTAAAKPALERLATAFPNDFPVQEALGLIEAEAGDAREALPHLLAGQRAQPRNPAANANLGAAYLQLKQYKNAIGALRTASQLESGNASTQADLGHALFLDGQPRAAAEALGRASRLRPEDRDLTYDWAVALDASGQSLAALAAFAVLPPEAHTAAMESLWGDVAEHAGRYQEALEHFKVAATLDSSEPNVYALTVELLRHWTWQPAEQMADFGLSRYPNSQRLRFAKGVALYGSTKFVPAAAVFATLLREDPESATYGDLLGRSCSATGGADSPECGSLIEFAKKHPGNARVAVYAAISILHRPEADQDLPLAEQLLRGSIAVDPNASEAYYQLGALQQQRQDWEASAASLRRAVQLRPSYAEAHYRLSRAYAHLRQADLARTELALQQRYAKQEKETSDAQLKEVTIFLTDTH